MPHPVCQSSQKPVSEYAATEVLEDSEVIGGCYEAESSLPHILEHLL